MSLDLEGSLGLRVSDCRVLGSGCPIRVGDDGDLFVLEAMFREGSGTYRMMGVMMKLLNDDDEWNENNYSDYLIIPV